MKPSLVFSSILLAGALGASSASAGERALQPVLVTRVHYEPREQAQALPGIVKARTESELSFRVGGRIERRVVDAGAFVHKGDALAYLDQPCFVSEVIRFSSASACVSTELAEASSASACSSCS